MITFPNMTRMDFPQLCKAMNVRHAVEIGVHLGDYSYHLLKYSNVDLLWSVDPFWGRYFPTSHKQTLETLKEFGSRSVVQHMTSIEAAKIASETGQRFGFVYIDGDHRTAAVKKDIRAWIPLLEPPGIIAGHDYLLSGTMIGCDVKNVVNYFQRRMNKTLYLTGEKLASWFFILG